MLAVSSQSAVYYYKDVVDCRLNVNNEKYSEQFPSHIFTEYKIQKYTKIQRLFILRFVISGLNYTHIDI